MAFPIPVFQWGIGVPDRYNLTKGSKLWFPKAFDATTFQPAIDARARQAPLDPEPEPLRAPQPELSVANQPWEYVYAEPPPVVRPVLPGPVAVRDTAVPRAVVVVEGVSTEVERHPEGDFPAGSIFAPGQTWGAPVHELDTDPLEDATMGWMDVLDWGLDTLSGQQPWQIGGVAAQAPIQSMSFAPPMLPPPSGVPGSPTTIYGYSGGKAVTTPGDQCGNRRYVTLDRETGKISCKRRRRRRLLTNRDLADLASLKTITGGGAALNAAVIRAVR